MKQKDKCWKIHLGNKINMITAKLYQYLLGLVINEKPLPDDATTEEQQAYKDIKK